MDESADLLKNAELLSPKSDRSRFEGPFHDVFWQLLKPHTQSSIARVLASRSDKLSEQAIRNHWNRRNWEQPELSVMAGQPECRIYPHLHEILELLDKLRLSNADEIRAFVRYRFLKDAHRQFLYVPYAERRMSRLLTWLYFPDDDSESARADAERASFLLAFNNDARVYRHICVLVDRLLPNPIHRLYLRHSLPRLALLMTLFGDYQLSVDLCRQTTNMFAEDSGSDDQDQVCLRYELECIGADAFSHMTLPNSLQPADRLHQFVARMKEHLGYLKRTGNEEAVRTQETIVRMGLCAYMRALVRLTMHLRGVRTPYTLADDTKDLLAEYCRLAEGYRARVDKDPLADKERLSSGHHYLGLDYDTLARAYAFLGPEIEIRKAKARSLAAGSTSQRSSKFLSEASSHVGKCFRKADEFSRLAAHYFAEGDIADRKFLAEYSPTENLLLDGVRCTHLSTYRRLSTQALIAASKALFAARQEDFAGLMNEAADSRIQFEREVGTENLRHARILNERIKNLIDGTKFEERYAWFHLLV